MQRSLDGEDPFAIFAPCAKISDACLRSTRILHYYGELMRLGLWPITDSTRALTIDSILVKFTQYENLPGDFGDNGPCKCTPIDFKKLLAREAKHMEKACKGLCLKCVQNGRFSPREGNCQAMHRSLCSPRSQMYPRTQLHPPRKADPGPKAYSRSQPL